MALISDVMPTTFEGAKLMIQKGLSNHFQVSHTINLCSSNPSGYRFGATYVGTKQLSPSEAFPVILGDIDPAGNLNANIIHQISPNVRCKFASQVKKTRFSSVILEIRSRKRQCNLTFLLIIYLLLLNRFNRVR